MPFPPYFCAFCAQPVTSPVILDARPFHSGQCVSNYLLGGPTYHHAYLEDLHLAAVYGLDVAEVAPSFNPPPPLPRLLCADCGIRSTECSPCAVCSDSLCLGCQDRHRSSLHDLSSS